MVSHDVKMVCSRLTDCFGNEEEKIDTTTTDVNEEMEITERMINLYSSNSHIYPGFEYQFFKGATMQKMNIDDFLIPFPLSHLGPTGVSTMVQVPPPTALCVM